MRITKKTVADKRVREDFAIAPWRTGDKVRSHAQALPREFQMRGQTPPKPYPRLTKPLASSGKPIGAKPEEPLPAYPTAIQVDPQDPL